MSRGIAIMGELSRRGVKAFAVLSFMAFTSCAIAGRGAFHLFTPPSRYAARTMQPTIRSERPHLSCGTEPRAHLNGVSQRGHLGANVPRMARRSPKPLGWVRFPTVPATFLGVAQLAERVAWDHEAVRAGLTTQTIRGEV